MKIFNTIFISSEKISVIYWFKHVFSPQINEFSSQMEYSESDLLVVVVRKLDYQRKVGILNLQIQKPKMPGFYEHTLK